MRAVRVAGDAKGVEVVDVPEPEPDGDSVLVEVTHVGICGSDHHLVGLGVPHTLGHEFGGRLDGRPVAVEPMVHCGECDACREGATSRCSVGTRGLWGIHRDGGMAERVAVDRACITELPAGFDPSLVALVEPLAVGVHAVHRVDLEPGVRVAVVGGGTVGLVAGALARRAGAEVDIVTRHDTQHLAAERLGLGTEPGRRYDVVVEAAGTTSALEAAVGLSRSGAAIVVAGTYWEPAALGMAAQLKEVSLFPVVYYGHHHGEREFEEAARLVVDMPELVDALVTHHFALDDAAEAFRVSTDRAAGAIKVLMEVG